jgi:glycosyltransferase involved in cell wall biosynthesis
MVDRVTLHLLGFPHTRLDESVPTCAYTAKVNRFRRMDMGRDLIVYGTEGADVQLLTEFERTSLFGPDDPARLPAWPSDEQWWIFNARAVAAIAEKATSGDLVLLAGGQSQHTVAAALPHLRFCEPFVGYEGIATDFCAFESYAWMHHVYGQRGIVDGRWFDTVIPNYFDPDDFPQGGGGDYLLYVGRLIERKGVHVAQEIANHAGVPLVVAGPGPQEIAPDAHHHGSVGPAQRAELMGGALAVLCPTVYIEPFGGVAVEAQLCGTPAITTDWGAFTETVETGWRFRTLAQALDCIDRARSADRDHIRDRALDRYSLTAVAPMFRDWFDKLDSLNGDGWYQLPERTLAAA